MQMSEDRRAKVGTEQLHRKLKSLAVLERAHHLRLNNEQHFLVAAGFAFPLVDRRDPCRTSSGKELRVVKVVQQHPLIISVTAKAPVSGEQARQMTAIPVSLVAISVCTVLSRAWHNVHAGSKPSFNQAGRQALRMLFLGRDIHHGQVVTSGVHTSSHGPLLYRLMLGMVRVRAGSAHARSAQQRNSHSCANHLAHQAPPRACTCMHGAAAAAQTPEQPRRPCSAQHVVLAPEGRLRRLRSLSRTLLCEASSRVRCRLRG